MTAKKYSRNFVSIVAFLLLLLAIGLGYAIKGYHAKLNDQSLIIAALQTGVKKSVDKYGRETAEKHILKTSFKLLQSQRVSDSSEIGRLQKIVNKRTSSAAVINSTTSGTLTGSTTITYKPGDTIRKPGEKIYPIYTGTLTDQWATMVVSANKDSVSVSPYTIKNEYVVTQELGDKEGKWPFRYRSPVLKVKNMNPHTTTDKINAWAVQTPNPKKQVLKGAAIGAAAVILLKVVVTGIAK